MSKSDQNNCILLGLPQSGKTTFLAALWHVVESGEVLGSLKVSSQPEDRLYLNGLRNSWLKCEPLERTKAESMKEIAFSAINSSGEELGSLIVPDVSGEMYRLQFEARTISQDFSELASKANGIVLFVDPDTIKKPIPISSVPVQFRQRDAVVQYENGEAWKHNDVPTQVILVDLLQILHSKINRPIKLSVIISAWDLITNAKDKDINGLTPDEWLTKNLPLLSQYLKSNEYVFPFATYGVSAQGSNYEGDNQKLHALCKPAERINVIFNGKSSNDITVPLKWILNEQI
jgi:hypothetical protein